MNDPLSANTAAFSLRTLLGTVTALCVVFALLGAMGVPPGAAVVGFLALGGLVTMQVVLIELVAAAGGYRAP